MMRHTRALVLALAATALSASACASTARMHVMELMDVTQAMLGTPDTRIEAEDGTFTMAPEMTIAMPFASYDCPLRPNTGNHGAAETWGARRVRVETPYHDEALYGLLSFCPVPAEATGPATRLSLVQVPEAYVNQTHGGRVSVVYEPINFTNQARGTAPAITQWPAWILYLSRQPFPAAAAAPSVPEATPVRRQLGRSLD